MHLPAKMRVRRRVPALLDNSRSATMTDVTLAPRAGARRIYNFTLPARVPGFGIGIAIKMAKSRGIWDEFPEGLRRRLTKAKGTFGSGYAFTKADLDSI